MFPLSLKFAVVGAIFALTAAAHSPYADTIVQIPGPVGPYAPIMSSVGNKHVVAFFVPGDGRCNVQAVFWKGPPLFTPSSITDGFEFSVMRAIVTNQDATTALRYERSG